MQKWLEKQSDDVQFIVQPTIFSNSWQPGAQAFYTAETLGVMEKIHPALFDAIHKDQRKKLLGNDFALEQFFEEQGVEPAAFRKAWNSFTVRSKTRKAVHLTRKSRIQGVPAIIVNGKYFTDVGTAGGKKELFEVLDYLIQKERGQNPVDTK